MWRAASSQVAVPGGGSRAKAATGRSSATASGRQTRRPAPSCVTARPQRPSNGRCVAGSRRGPGAGWPREAESRRTAKDWRRCAAHKQVLCIVCAPWEAVPWCATHAPPQQPPGPWGGWVGLGWVGRRPHPTAAPMVGVRTCATRLDWPIRSCPVARPAGLLTAPVPRGGTRGREMPSWLCVCGERALSVCRAYACAWGIVCCLVLQAPAGRLREPDSEPTGGVAGLDTLPPSRLTCCQRPHDCSKHGGSPALHSTGGGPHSLTALGTGGAALGWTYLPRRWGVAVGGAPGCAKRCPALGPARAVCSGGGATVRVNGGGGGGHTTRVTAPCWAPGGGFQHVPGASPAAGEGAPPCCVAPFTFTGLARPTLGSLCVRGRMRSCSRTCCTACHRPVASLCEAVPRGRVGGAA